MNEKNKKDSRGRQPPPQKRKSPKKRGSFVKLNSAQRAEAEKISQRSGIPLPDAYRVAAGLTTVNDVLKALLAKEKMRKLAAKGIEMSLAGQVAKGLLSEKKAILLTEIRKRHGNDYNFQGLAAFLENGNDVLLSIFSRGTVVGKITSISKYTIVFSGKGAESDEEIRKHDLKFFTSPAFAEKIAEACGTNEKIKALNLSSSSDKRDRYRPDDSELLEMLKNGGKHTFTMRDGTTLAGTVIFIRRYEFGLRTKNGAEATIFFHSLIKA